MAKYFGSTSKWRIRETMRTPQGGPLAPPSRPGGEFRRTRPDQPRSGGAEYARPGESFGSPHRRGGALTPLSNARRAMMMARRLLGPLGTFAEIMTLARQLQDQIEYLEDEWGVIPDQYSNFTLEYKCDSAPTSLCVTNYRDRNFFNRVTYTPPTSCPAPCQNHGTHYTTFAEAALPGLNTWVTYKPSTSFGSTSPLRAWVRTRAGVPQAIAHPLALAIPEPGQKDRRYKPPRVTAPPRLGDRPPAPNTKEHKWILRDPALAKVYGKATELNDFLNCALKNMKKRPGHRKPPPRPGLHNKLRYVMQNAGDIDIPGMTLCVATEQAKDVAIGFANKRINAGLKATGNWPFATGFGRGSFSQRMR